MANGSHAISNSGSGISIYYAKPNSLSLLYGELFPFRWNGVAMSSRNEGRGADGGGTDWVPILL